MKNILKFSLALIALVLALASTASAETFQKRFNHFSSALEECGGYHNARLYACKTSDMSNSCISGKGMSWDAAETFFNNLPRHGSPYCGGVWVVYDEGVQEVVQNNDQPQDQGYADNGFGSQIGQITGNVLGQVAVSLVSDGGFQNDRYQGGGYDAAPSQTINYNDDHSINGSFNTDSHDRTRFDDHSRVDSSTRLDSHNRSRVDSHNRTVNPAPTVYPRPTPFPRSSRPPRPEPTPLGTPLPRPTPRCTPANPRTTDPNRVAGQPVYDKDGNLVLGTEKGSQQTASRAATAPVAAAAGSGANRATVNKKGQQTKAQPKVASAKAPVAKAAPTTKVAKVAKPVQPRTVARNNPAKQQTAKPQRATQTRSARTPTSAQPMQQHRSAPAPRVRQAPRMQQQRPTFRSAPRMQQRSAPRMQSHGGGRRK